MWVFEQVPRCGYCQSGTLMAAAASPTTQWISAREVLAAIRYLLSPAGFDPPISAEQRTSQLLITPVHTATT